jgi:hypothetical protein
MLESRAQSSTPSSMPLSSSFSFLSWSHIFHHGCFFGIVRVVISNSWLRVTSKISLWLNLKISFLDLILLFHISLLQIMDEAQERVVFTMGFMMLFQLMDRIYNSPIQDLHSIMNPSIELEIVKFFFSIIALHKSNLTTTYGNLS